MNRGAAFTLAEEREKLEQLSPIKSTWKDKHEKQGKINELKYKLEMYERIITAVNKVKLKEYRDELSKLPEHHRLTRESN